MTLNQSEIDFFTEGNVVVPTDLSLDPSDCVMRHSESFSGTNN